MALDMAKLEGMVRDWYAALDTHEPVATLIDMLSDLEIRMVFPEATLEGVDAFTNWYEGVIRIFFDEIHHVESVSVEGVEGSLASIKVVVRWEASRWLPPAARSERIVLLAYQSWSVRIGDDGTARIATYIVDRLEYLPGSAQL